MFSATIMTGKRCICRDRSWRRECPVNQLLQHPQFLGSHHHEGIAEAARTTVDQVRWHDEKLEASGERKVLDFDLGTWREA